jgi:L-alanine-DL-glutamate epimerase-like enolase superfamily enzyme
VTPITPVGVSVYTIPTESPESDGTVEWISTTIVIVELTAGGVAGLGYTYAHKACAASIADMLLPILHGHDAMDVTGAWIAMTRAIRNQGRPGIDGVYEPSKGLLRPDMSRSGLGLDLKRADASRYAA